MEAIAWFVPLAAGLFGLLFGSFANVVIWRVPRGESVVSPPSRCPSCGTRIRWYDNVPVLAWLLLRGRCRDCGAPISGRYPAVEALAGVLWALAAIRFGLSWQTLSCIVFFHVLLVLTFIDIDTMRLPNPIVGALAIMGAVGALVSQATGVPVVPIVPAGSGLVGQPIVQAALGALAGAGLSAGIAALYGGLRGRTGMGAGDVKLLGAMGLFLGPYVLLALFAGSVVGAAGGLVDAARRRESVTTHRIPFGPYLALGGVLTALGGPAAWAWYVGLIVRR